KAALVVGRADRDILHPEAGLQGEEPDLGVGQRLAVEQQGPCGRDDRRGGLRAARQEGGRTQRDRRQGRSGHGRFATSPAIRVESACSSGRSLVLVRLTNRTDPSQKTKFAPPVWPLPNALMRGSVTLKSLGLLPSGHR